MSVLSTWGKIATRHSGQTHSCPAAAPTEKEASAIAENIKLVARLIQVGAECSIALQAILNRRCFCGMAVDGQAARVHAACCKTFHESLYVRCNDQLPLNCCLCISTQAQIRSPCCECTQSNTFTQALGERLLSNKAQVGVKCSHTLDGQNPAPRGHDGKQLLYIILFVGIYRRIIIPGVSKWCRISSMHSWTRKSDCETLGERASTC